MFFKWCIKCLKPSLVAMGCNDTLSRMRGSRLRNEIDFLMFCEIEIEVICFINQLLGHFQKRSLTFFSTVLLLCNYKFKNHSLFSFLLEQLYITQSKFSDTEVYPWWKKAFWAGVCTYFSVEFYDVFFEEF